MSAPNVLSAAAALLQELQKKVESDTGSSTPETLSPIPTAFHLCTDQMNACRIYAHFGKQLLVCGGTWYCWNGRNWERDETFANRCGAELARIVREEAAAARAIFESLAETNPDARKLEQTKRRDMSGLQDKLLATPATAEIVHALDKAEALEKWAKACESKIIQHNALELLRGWLTFDRDKMDADPALLTCLNGTIDLRTGKLKPHDPADYITKCAPVNYDPAARADRFEKFLIEIMDGDADRVAFLRRWFGYGVTGETREQKVVLHIGRGANGKSKLFEALQDALGSYMHTTAASLLTASGQSDRHPTEVADLCGRRLVTAYESEDGTYLREAFLKHATGEDVLSGRFMRQDFFNFKPTFKLQLLSNHKPIVKGSDYGIWRRILLVWYGVTFGSEQDVAAGRAQKVRDTDLRAKLDAEREGILAWLVRGAVEWHRDGLRPPDAVLAAGREFQQEQDRVSKFVEEVCILDAKAWSPFTGLFGGLYPAYTSWCRDSGYQALGKSRFLEELERVVPGFRKAEQKQTVDGVRKTIRGCYGLRVNMEGDGGGVTESQRPIEDMI